MFISWLNLVSLNMFHDSPLLILFLRYLFTCYVLVKFLQFVGTWSFDLQLDFFLGFGCKCTSNVPMLTFCLNCFSLYVLPCGGDLDIHCLYTLHLLKSWMFAFGQNTQFDNQYSWLFMCRVCKLSTLLHCVCGMHKFWLTFANV